MPIYEYRCPDCEHEYEKREGFDAPAQQTCPNCGGGARRVLQAPPIVFKGSGFYVTDSRSSAPETDSKPSVSDGAKETSTKSTDGAKDSSTKSGDSSTGKDAEAAAAG